jgi:transaldolase/glucose-6-phosphate isomerase
MNPLVKLKEQGQSVWLDYIRRTLVTGGELQRMMEEDGLAGVTSNPAIFEKAIGGSSDYVEALRQLVADTGLNPMELYERLALEDIRLAADVLSPVYEQSEGQDGFVSLEVSPHLAGNTARTCAEARRLWRALDRDNVMIKVPATPEGIPAITTLVSEGINVNVTLLFSREVYEQVADAYLRGLEQRVAAGGDPGRVASVASFFVSRIDTLVDSVIDRRLGQARSESEKGMLKSIRGRVAIANVKLAYQSYRQLFGGDRWNRLQERGARVQRLLWASTSTKNPEYRDVMYVEELIGPDTVNTLPPATYQAFREHGQVRPSLEEGLDGANTTMADLGQLDIPIQGVTERLLRDGVRVFADAFDKMLAAVDDARRHTAEPPPRRQSRRLPGELETRVRAEIAAWQGGGKVHRLWERDASLWTGAGEGKWLAWLGIVPDQLEQIERLREVTEDVRQERFSHILLLGMGGSSLCPEVLKKTFGSPEGYPELHVLDSTDPAQVQSFEQRIDLARTLFIVSSKSGNTLEPNIFKDFFFERVSDRLGAEAAGSRFMAITDPGSALQAVAEKDRFRKVHAGVSGIGGRYSALSDFGMVPAAAMGLDIDRLLHLADEMVEACAACVPVEENPGLRLGTILGVLGRQGRDKVTLIASAGIAALGAWLEQLLAESTGKKGKGLIPVDGERPGPPEVYGRDRLFVYLRLGTRPDPAQDEAVDQLEQDGQPVIRIPVVDPYHIGQEFFRWEFATAVAGSILEINPFDQPDVEASKVATRDLTREYESKRAFPPENPFMEGEGLALFTDRRNAADLDRLMGNGRSVEACLQAHLDRLQVGDYFGLLAYLEMNDQHAAILQEIRLAVRDAKRVATCLGFGPRFLHSTGQAYKGGPNTGVFLQLTCDDAVDLPVPGRKYTFGVVKAAQARGDFQVLADRERRALRVHLGRDIGRGLTALRDRVVAALSSEGD